MAYPEKQATHHHRPKFIERMKEAEAEPPRPFQPEQDPAGDLTAPTGAEED